MSAFIIQESTMHKAVAAMRSRELGSMRGNNFVTPEQLHELGLELFKLNQEAVRQRYGSVDPIPDYRFHHPHCGKPSLFKALQCLLYQCSEGNVPETSLYREMCERRDELAREIVCELPEYRNSEWD